MKMKVRENGIREVKMDGGIHLIPPESELCPRSMFSDAWRRGFFETPHFMHMSRSDINCAEADLLLAARHDLLNQRDRLPLISQELEAAIWLLEDQVAKLVPREVAEMLAKEIQERAKANLAPSVGPQFEDEVWYKDVDRVEVVEAQVDLVEGERPTLVPRKTQSSAERWRIATEIEEHLRAKGRLRVNEESSDEETSPVRQISKPTDVLRKIRELIHARKANEKDEA